MSEETKVTLDVGVTNPEQGVYELARKLTYVLEACDVKLNTIGIHPGDNLLQEPEFDLNLDMPKHAPEDDPNNEAEQQQYLSDLVEYLRAEKEELEDDEQKFQRSLDIVLSTFSANLYAGEQPIRWLSTPNRLTEGKAPIEVLRTNQQSVFDAMDKYIENAP